MDRKLNLLKQMRKNSIYHFYDSTDIADEIWLHPGFILTLYFKYG